MDVGLERGDHDDSGTNILRNIKDVGDQRRILFGQHNLFFTSHSHGVSVSRDNIIISTLAETLSSQSRTENMPRRLRSVPRCVNNILPLDSTMVSVVVVTIATIMGTIGKKSIVSTRRATANRRYSSSCARASVRLRYQF